MKTHAENRLVLFDLVSALHRQLKTLANGSSSLLEKTAKSPTAADKGHTLDLGTINRPSMHDRVSIQSHRDDWP